MARNRAILASWLAANGLVAMATWPTGGSASGHLQMATGTWPWPSGHVQDRPSDRSALRELAADKSTNFLANKKVLREAIR